MSEWYTKIAEQVVGPLSSEQLKALADGGRLAPGDPVSKSAEGPWVPASRVKGLFEAASAQPEGEAAASETAADKSKPQVEWEKEAATAGASQRPPIPQPPVVMPAGDPVTSSVTQTVSDASPEGTSVADGAPGGFAIQAEEMTAAERLHRKRRKKERKPLTKKEKNAQLVKRLAIALAAGAIFLISIPLLRPLFRSAPEDDRVREPVADDLSVESAPGSLDDIFGGPSASRDTSGESRGGGPGWRAGTAESGAGDVDVRLVRVALDRPRLMGANGEAARPAKRFLVFEFELRAGGSGGARRFHGWNDDADKVSLTDAAGKEYELRTPRNFSGFYADGQVAEPVFLSSEEPTTEVLLFVWPEEGVPELPTTSDESLYLRLPRAAYGEEGEVLREIPLAAIEATEEAMDRPQFGPPGAGTSDNVEEDGRGPIPIPGLR